MLTKGERAKVNMRNFVGAKSLMLTQECVSFIPSGTEKVFSLHEPL